MKKIFLLLISLVILFSPMATIEAEETNLVYNPKVQESVSGQPLGFETGSWGVNSPTYEYKTDSLGNKSLLVTMNSYLNGDAKWFFSPVSIKPNSQYLFSDSYSSSVSTEVVAQIIDINGRESYQYLGANLPSSSWKTASFLFTTPSYASKLTVFHLINQNGFLQTDNFLLQESAPQITPNGIPNGSLETPSIVNSSLPKEWQKNSWGTNTAKFSYLTTGHNSNRSVKINMSNYSSGDAKWFYTPQPVTSGAHFVYSNYYMSNVATEVDLMINKADGTTQFVGLGILPAAGTWTEFKTYFQMPESAKTATVMHIIYKNGYLTTDDYSLSTYIPQKFSRPLVSLTFDDAWDQNLTTAFPIMDQYGFKSTQYYTTQYIENQYDRDNIKRIFDSGHEIGSHTLTHPFLTQVGSKRLNNELLKSKQILESIVGVGNVTSFATPYGDYNTNVTNAVKKYYQTNRNTDTGWNSKDNLDIYNIRVQNMTNTTTFEQFKSWVDKAMADQTWLVVVYHNVSETPGLYDVKTTDFTGQMQYLKQQNVAVLTLSQALQEALAQ